MEKELKIWDRVKIPTSELGKKGNIGEILSIWNGKISVNFSGKIGHYTLSKHEVIKID